MSANEAILLVARFLKSHDYTETLEALIREANLAADAGTTNRGDLTIEKVLEEKKVFDVSLNFEKLGDDSGKQWLPSAPAIPTLPGGPTSSNILHVSIANVEDVSSTPSKLLFATTADRRLNMFDLPTCDLKRSLTSVQDAPVLSCVVLRHSHLVSGSMGGRIAISDLSGNVIDYRRDHNKYVVQITTQDHNDETYIATAGWDAKVHLYRVKCSSEAEKPQLGDPVATIALPTNPEALLFIRHPDNGRPVLLVTRKDSTHLYYHSTEPGAPLLGKQNIAPRSTANPPSHAAEPYADHPLADANSWTHQTPSSLALCPIDETIVAIATSAIPHMKLLIVRLLVPPMTSIAISGVPAQTPSQAPGDEVEGPPAAAARAALALQDREAAAILIHCNTLAPQTSYSTPSLAWRPDGSGVWVNSDDGVLRGIEVSTGKVVATLKGGHDAGSKIRCLCTGMVTVDDMQEEWLVSGGFDQKLIVWKPAK